MSYTPKEWVTGDVIHAEDMNHIEEGITENEGAILENETSIADVKGDLDEIETSLETKAEIDGYYEDMTVGDAEQLVSTQFIEDSVPYLYRTSGGSADIGNREYDEIVGGTIAWNQLIATANKSGSVTPSGSTAYSYTSKASNFKNGHVYFNSMKVLYTGEKTNTVYNYFQMGAATGTSRATLDKIEPNTTKLQQGLCKPTSDGTSLVVGASTGDSSNPMLTTDAWAFDDLMSIDLTAMFGSTIADYIYTLEQNNAGDGVAWFKRLFPKDYYAYNAGELMSVNAIEHDTVGFNQWDEEWEVGAINTSTGENASTSTTIRSKNYIPVFPNTTYYKQASTNLLQFYYDADKNFIGYGQWGVGTFTTPSNCAYIRFYMYNYGTTYNNDICINLSWSGTRDGEYETYQKHSYPLDDSLTLRGIPKLDASNNLYYDGDTYAADGTVTRRYTETQLSDLRWTQRTISGDNTYYTAKANSTYTANAQVKGVFVCCPLYNIADLRSGETPTDGVLKLYSNYAGNGETIMIHDSSVSSIAELVAKLEGKGTVVSNLATPTTEEAEPYQEIQIVNDWGTEEYVTDSIVPVGHNTKYPQNLRDKLQHLPNLASADGKYVIQQAGTQMSLAPLETPTELLAAPTTDGTYVLTATVASSDVTYTWESEGE